MRIILGLWLCLLASSGASAACPAKTGHEVAAVLAKAIELNERFKASVQSSDEATRHALREQLESYGEQAAMPCAREAAHMLSKHPDRRLLRRLLEFAVSHENAADETVSDSLAAVLTRRRQEVEREVAGFPAAQKRLLLKQIEAGLQRRR
jgi:hypothetical protein